MEKGLKKEDSLALKGVAILLMVTVHCFRLSEVLENYNVVFRGVSVQQVLNSVSYAKICVSIFAFVSGYGLLYGYRANENTGKISSAGWTAVHVFRLLSGFWFISVLSYPIYKFGLHRYLSKLGDTYQEIITTIVTDIAGFSGLFGTKSLNGTWWYMSAAVVYILLLPVFAGLLKRYGGIVCLGLTIAVPRILGLGYQGGNAVLSFWPVFLAGMISCQYGLFDRFRKWQPLKQENASYILKFVLLLCLIVFGKWSFNYIPRSLYWEYSFAAVPIPVILFCTEYLFRIRPVRNIFCFLGKHSMNIWLVHTFVRDWMRHLIYSLREAAVILLAVLLISLAVSYIIEFLKTITGYHRLIGHLTEKILLADEDRQ